MTYLILYVPVLHAGYLRFFEKYAKADRLYVLGEELIEELTFYSREIRQLDPQEAKRLIHGGGYFADVRTLDPESILEIGNADIVTSTQAICSRLVERYFGGSLVIFDSLFLQWDEQKVTQTTPVTADYVVSREKFDRMMMDVARDEANQSSDWWRRTAAVLVRDGEIVLMAHNHHVPSDETQYIDGDPRDFVSPGTDSQIATSLHAEQALITLAALEGVSLVGCDLYTPVFPCPMCAKQVAYSGIKRIFFLSGHASIDGESILRSQDVEIVLVR